MNNPSGSLYPDIQYEDVKHFYDDFEIRFQNNLLFNKILSEKCMENNIKYLDINDEILDNITGTVKDIYKPTRIDHHLIPNQNLTKILLDKLLDILNK